MFRVAFIGLAVYAVGHPRFDGARPPVLDRPLTAFHTDVNHVAGEALKVLTVFDGFRRMDYLTPVSTALARAAKP